MKKIFFIFLSILLLSGCRKSFPLNLEEIQTITYDNVTLLEKEYPKVIEYFNDLNWKKGTLDEKIKNNITITSKNEVTSIKITENNHFIYQKQNNIYHSKDSSLIDFINYLEKKKAMYLNEDFYSISMERDYQKGNNDVFIKLEQGDYYYILTSQETITDFRIHELEKNKNSFEDINVLYQKELVEKGHRIVIRISNPVENHIRITFSTPYRYQVSIIPNYNPDTKKITYLKQLTPKENS